MKLRHFIGLSHFIFACARAYIVGTLFAVSCFAAADGAKKENGKFERARAAVVNKSQTAQADIRRDLAGEPDAKVRARLVSVLGHTAMDKASMAEIRARLADADPSVRSEAVVALGQSRDKTVAPDLRNVLMKDSSEGVRMAAAFWLGALKDPGSIPVLSRALANDSDPNVRAQAAHSLKWVGTSEARNELHKGRADKDRRVRKIAE